MWFGWRAVQHGVEVEVAAAAALQSHGRRGPGQDACCCRSLAGTVCALMGQPPSPRSAIHVSRSFCVGEEGWRATLLTHGANRELLDAARTHIVCHTGYALIAGVRMHALMSRAPCSARARVHALARPSNRHTRDIPAPWCPGMSSRSSWAADVCVCGAREGHRDCEGFPSAAWATTHDTAPQAS